MPDENPPSEIIIQPAKIRRPRKTKVKKHRRKWWNVDKHLRRLPLSKQVHTPAVKLPIDPTHPKPSRRGVIATYSYDYIQKNPDLLEGVTPPEKRYLQVDVTKNWFMFRMIDPDKIVGGTHRTITPSEDTQMLRGIHKDTGKWVTQSYRKRRPKAIKLVTPDET